MKIDANGTEIRVMGDVVETCNDAIELCRKEVLELERKLKNGEV